MGDVAGLGRLLLVAGAGLMALGGIILLSDRVPGLGWLGKLPGDLLFRRGDATIYVPIMTSIVLSVVLSILVAVILRRQ